MRSRQRGVALVTAMLIVAIVATLATSLALGQQVWLRQTQNLADLAQAERLRQGAIEFASAVLARDAKNSQTRSVDHLGEDWAKPIPPLPVDGGAVLIAITDAQGRFNLNNLARTTPSQPGGSPTSDDPVFLQLLLMLKLDAQLLETLKDWLDADSNVRPGGAEDLEYLALDPPYRPANRLLETVDELRLIKGYTPEVVEALRPYVTVLPVNQSPINVNTAPPMVLAALVPNATEAMAEPIVRAREATPFKDAAAFKSAIPGVTNFNGTYNVTTDYFIVSIDTRIGRTQRLTETLIKRPPGGSNVQALWYRVPAFKIVLDEDKT